MLSVRDCQNGRERERERELKDLKDHFREDFPVGPLIGKCRTGSIWF
jgi:hypothetical protein